MSKSSVAVIGAGLSGLVCAQKLAECGKFDVTVFEKSRGAGGRLATQRESETWHFDHGAPYFTVRDAVFKQHVETWEKNGVVAPWNGRIQALYLSSKSEGRFDVEAKESIGVERWVGIPGMNSISRYLTTNLQKIANVHFDSLITKTEYTSKKWRLDITRQNNLQQMDFEALVVTAPMPQTVSLLKPNSVLKDLLHTMQNDITFSANWATTIVIKPPLTELPFDGAFINYKDDFSPHVLRWISRDSSKPQRPVNKLEECWVLHADTRFSEENVEKSPEEITPILQNAFLQILRATNGDKQVEFVFAKSHRWRYGIPQIHTTQAGVYFDQNLRIACAGDWAHGSRVEGAFLSGFRASNAMLSSLPQAKF